MVATEQWSTCVRICSGHQNLWLNEEGRCDAEGL